MAPAAPAPAPAGLPRTLLVVLGVLALVGLALSLTLTRVHYLSHTDPGYHALCAVSDRVNCETVAVSPYSVWLGVPVSIWGTLTYALLAVLVAWGWSRRRLHDAWPGGALLLVGVIGILVSLALAYVSLARIDAICLYCNALYVVNAAVLALAVGALVRRRLRPGAAIAADARALARHPRAAAGLVVPAAAAALALLLGYPPYWRADAGRDRAPLPTGRTDAGEHWIGARTPAVTIVEYTDYECPFCRRAHRDLRQRLPGLADRVRLVHKHFPLDQACNPMVKRAFHRHACELSFFVECAGQQGHFWAANDAVMTALERRRADTLDTGRIAARLGLDAPKLRACLAAGTTRAAVAADVTDGLRRHVAGTPTYFVGNARHTGGLTAAKLEALLASPDAARPTATQRAGAASSPAPASQPFHLGRQ